MTLQTEYDFTLPKGYIDRHGTRHREGRMRLATAADEIYPLKDPRVAAWPAYLIVILLSRVVLRIGRVTDINPAVVEGLFAEDLAYLQDLYNRLNGLAPRTVQVSCPYCARSHEAEVALLGG